MGSEGSAQAAALAPLPEWRLVLCALATAGIQVCYARPDQHGLVALAAHGAVGARRVAGVACRLAFRAHRPAHSRRYERPFCKQSRPPPPVHHCRRGLYELCASYVCQC